MSHYLHLLVVRLLYYGQHGWVLTLDGLEYWFTLGMPTRREAIHFFFILVFPIKAVLHGHFRISQNGDFIDFSANISFSEGSPFAIAFAPRRSSIVAISRLSIQHKQPSYEV